MTKFTPPDESARDFTIARLDALGPPPSDSADAPRALRRFQTRLAENPDLQQANPLQTLIHVLERTVTMPKQNLSRFQPAIIALTLVGLVALSFSFAPVRALAGEFLSIFRVQNVVVVPVNTDQIANLEGNSQLEAMFEQISNQAEVLVDGGEPYPVDSLSEASTAVDFSLASLATAGDPTSVQVVPQSMAQFYLDKDLAEAVFEAAQIEVSLPDSLNDTPIVINKPTMVSQVWGEALDLEAMKEQAEGERFDRHDGPRGRSYDSGIELVFVQMRSPEIEYPDDLDLNGLGTAGLQLLGYSELEATALSATIDWANTLVLPLPTDADVNVESVSVNGASGQLMSNSDGSHTALTWQADGITYFLTSNGTYLPDGLLLLAESMQ
jgi:hypothetical protein